MATEGDLPDSCFAFVPSEARGANGTKSARKLRICELDSGKPSCPQIGRAAAAVSGGGFRGNRVQGVGSAMGAVKRKIRAAGNALRCWDSPDAVPDSIKP
jgi:hypothetical protein